MPSQTWTPIGPLTRVDRDIDLADIQSVYETWKDAQARLRESSANNLAEFNRRLVRRLSIETGILERIYDIDRGTTEALVEFGFREELISRSSTDVEPTHLIDILRDQEAAIQLVMDCVSGNRPLTKGVIHELHSILLRHQDTTAAIDQFGNRQDISLLKGHFKELPNNPRRPDGVIHEYCPPLHVDAQVEELLARLAEYDSEDPVVVAAWFHHRFTQIHPYQDGNGRVVRALTTLLLLRKGLLPLVVDRDLRVEYLDALECADSGDLSQLASLFARLERGAITQALSVNADAEISHQKTLAAAVVESLAHKFGRRREAKLAELREVNGLAYLLRQRAVEQLERAFAELREPLTSIGDPHLSVTAGGPDYGNSHWYKFEVVRCANEGGKYANFAEEHFFAKATMRVGQDRLVFVASLHHVGRELTGMMEGTAFARLESYEDPDDREYVSQDFSLCSLEPFIFTHKTKESDIAEAFARWLDAALAVAFKDFGDRL